MSFSINNSQSSTQQANMPPKMNPDLYAKKYAEENGISVQEAKDLLKSMYGDPAAKTDRSTSVYSTDENNLQSASISESFDSDSIFGDFSNRGFHKTSSTSTQESSSTKGGGKDPNAYAQEYATKHGMTLEEAKKELKEKYGDPSRDGAGMNFMS